MRNEIFTSIREALLPHAAGTLADLELVHRQRHPFETYFDGPAACRRALMACHARSATPAAVLFFNAPKSVEKSEEYVLSSTSTRRESLMKRVPRFPLGFLR